MSLLDDADLPVVAALYVCRTGPYWGRPDVDAWDEARDARGYAGPWPVIAHPPCAAWCLLAGLREARYGYPKGEDGGLFDHALDMVRRFGGVLEHPAYSRAWPAHGLAAPVGSGWIRTLDGGWTTEVDQLAYGHRARKRTWLYYVGERPPTSLRWERAGAAPAHVRGPLRPALGGDQANYGDRPRVWQAEAKRTPPEFAEAMIRLARGAR